MAMSEYEYNTEVRDTAAGILELMRDGQYEDEYEAIWQTLDSHQWTIYNGYHIQILEHSRNDDAYFQQHGALTAESASDAIRMMAVAAFGEDVSEAYHTAMEEYLERREERKPERRRARKASRVKRVIQKYGYEGIANAYLRGKQKQDAKAVVARMSKAQKTIFKLTLINTVSEGVIAEEPWALAYYKKMGVDDIKLMDQANYEGGLKTNSRRRSKRGRR